MNWFDLFISWVEGQYPASKKWIDEAVAILKNSGNIGEKEIGGAILTAIRDLQSGQSFDTALYDALSKLAPAGVTLPPPPA